MYSSEKKKKAVELYIYYHLSAAAVIRELGYPERKSLIKWHKDYQEGLVSGEDQLSKPFKSKYTEEQQRFAVEYYLNRGKCYQRTIKQLGYPTRATLRKWVEAIAPNERKIYQRRVEYTQKQKIEAVAAFRLRSTSAEKVGEKMGLSRISLYKWHAQLLPGEKGYTMTAKSDSKLPDDKDALLSEIEKLKKEIKKLKMERDLLEGAAELIKKDPGVSLQKLSNQEKTMLIDALRDRHPLEELMITLQISSSSYYYQRSAAKLEPKYTTIKEQMIDIFETNHCCYGYRRIYESLKTGGILISEKVVRKLMVEAGIKVLFKRKKKFQAYQGEVSPAPDNLIARNFHADQPNEKWLTDITEFSIPAGKVYLSPIVDCFDGLLVSWTIATKPTAEMANTMLDKAATVLKDDDHPIVHSDRGGHYRWPGWIERMNAYSLIRSMSKKACTPDNAACEGLFGRIKNEMFYNRSWHGVSIEAFMDYLDSYLCWYNEERIKISLGGLSPVRYRKQLGLAA
jgi:putative transposase